MEGGHAHDPAAGQADPLSAGRHEDVREVGYGRLRIALSTYRRPEPPRHPAGGFPCGARGGNLAAMFGSSQPPGREPERAKRAEVGASPPERAGPAPSADSEAEEVPRVGRVRLIAAELERERGARVRVRVVLEREGVEHVAERHGVGDDVLVLRLGVEATLEALERAIGRPGQFELVGAKRIHAFDDHVVLTCVTFVPEPEGGSRRLLGCVPLAGRGLAWGAAASLLNATNRVVEWLPRPAPGEPGAAGAQPAPEDPADGDR